jgi:ABC-type antimicrobial peptide transport system permease subunit
MAFSGEDGTVIAKLPHNISSSEISISYVSFSGIWVLEKIVGEKEYLIADGKWSIINPEKIQMNITDYSLSNIPLLRERSENSIEYLTLKIFLARGRSIGILNPLNEAPRMDPRLRINVLFLNFIEIRGANLAIIPIDSPIVINASLSYVDFSWKMNLSFIPSEEEFIDLTPIFVKSTSQAQVNNLKELADILRDYGFNLIKIYNKIEQLSLYYEQAAKQLEDQNYEEAMKRLYMAQRFYRDTHTMIINAYIDAIGWSPTLIGVLVFFSYSLSRIISEKRILSNIIFILLFSAIFLVFLSTHQGFRFFILGFHNILQKILMPSFTIFLLQILQIVSIIVVIIVFSFTQVRDFFSQTFGVSIKNLRRRKMRTLLTLFALMLISASAMCLLAVSPTNPIYYSPIYYLKPKVNNGLVIYKQLIITTKSSSSTSSYTPSPVTNYVTLQPYEISLLPREKFEAMNIYGIKTVRLSRSDGFTIDGFNIFNLIVVDSEFMKTYLSAPEIIGGWLNPDERNTILIGSKIASKYNLTEGSSILLNNRKFIVKFIFNEEKVAENLKDIDGDAFLFRIYDPINKEIIGDSFIFGLIKDFAIQEIEIYKVSLILRDEYAKNITGICNEILSLGFDYWETETSTFTLGYVIRVISGGSISQAFLGSLIFVLSGNWQNHIIPLTLVSLLLFMNALGTIFERSSEIRTIFTVGASPLRIRFLFIIEGVVLGVIGGIFGYIIGYMVAQTASSALPSLVQENLTGGSPFTISFFVSVFSSLTGYIVPSEKAVKTAVPSGVIKKKVSDIIKVRGEEAILEVPMRLQERDIKTFDMFLEQLTKDYDGTYYKEMILKKLSFDKSLDKSTWHLLLSYSSKQPTSFQISITVKVGKELEVSIKPYGKTREKAYWLSEYRRALKSISPILREELLKFLTFQKEYKGIISQY